MRTAKRVTLAVLAFVLAASVAQAQTNNASINATATVQQPINVTGVADLAFGNVLPGVNLTVAPSAANAGRFDVTGQASTPVSMTFVLPANLSFGANLLPIGTWAAEHRPTVAGAPTAFTPSGVATAANLSGLGELFVFVGATVTPSVNQPAGLYTGTVQMTVVY